MGLSCEVFSLVDNHACQQDEPQNMDITRLVLEDDKGEREIGQEIVAVNTSNPTAKKLKIVKHPFLQVMEYPTLIMELAKGKKIDT